MKAPTYLCPECKQQWEAASSNNRMLAKKLEEIRHAVMSIDLRFANMALQKLIIEIEAMPNG